MCYFKSEPKAQIERYRIRGHEKFFKMEGEWGTMVKFGGYYE